MAAAKRKPNTDLVTTGTELKLADADFPTLIAAVGGNAKFAYEEFVFGTLRNPNTRTAYLRAINQFLGWCDSYSIPLQKITPGDVGQYFDQHTGGISTKNQHLAALRHLFDVLVNRHVMILNPARTVRGERHSVVEGKTPEMTPKQVAELLKTIDTSNVVGLRDYVIIATLAYTAARVGAVAKLKRSSLRDASGDWSLRFSEKGGKQRIISVRQDLKHYLGKYLETAGLWDAPKPSPLFRSTIRREKRLVKSGMSAHAMYKMLKRRLRDAKMPDDLSPHSIRGGSATDLLSQGVPLEDVQYLLGHVDPRTTRLYDHRNKKVTRNIVERISTVTAEEA